MSNSQIIKDTAESFVNQNKSFTSVDIANAIKESGTWVKNSHVANWLRKNVKKLWSNYATTVIDVTTKSGDDVEAILYLEQSSDSSDYLQRNQQTMSKAEFESKQNATITASQVAKSTKKTADTNKVVSVAKTFKVNKNRLRIPKTIVALAGLEAFDVVDPSKITINGKALNTKKPLAVHSDGRVSVRVEGVSAKVSVNDGVIKVES